MTLNGRSPIKVTIFYRMEENQNLDFEKSFSLSRIVTVHWCTNVALDFASKYSENDSWRAESYRRDTQPEGFERLSKSSLRQCVRQFGWQGKHADERWLVDIARELYGLSDSDPDPSILLGMPERRFESRSNHETITIDRSTLTQIVDDRKGDAEIAFGIWRDKSAWEEQGRWDIEISVRARYETESTSVETLSAWLKQYLYAFRQDSVFVALESDCGIQAWLGTLNEHNELEIFPLSGFGKWQLNCVQTISAPECLSRIIHSVNALENAQTQMARQLALERYQDEYDLLETDDLPGRGASFILRGENEPVVLEVGDRFPMLFWFLFQPALVSVTGVDLAFASEPAILLGVQDTDDWPRGIDLAFYGPEPASSFCLCGNMYPQHDPTRQHNVVQMRALAERSIDKYYENPNFDIVESWKNGAEWNNIATLWKLLSSPHLYFQEFDIESPPTEGALKKSERNAVQRWEELVKNEFRGQALNLE